MKFLAILKDSLREAIDTKVFYVMVGLSAVITLLTFTISFKPRPGDQFFDNFMVRQLLTAGLTLDKPQDASFEQLMTMSRMPGFRAYKILGAQPTDGTSGGLTSSYKVTLSVFSPWEEDAVKLRDDPSPAVTRIKEHFGTIDEMRVLTVSDVRVAPSDDRFLPPVADPHELYFQADVTPTPQARRLWPHEPSLLFGAVPLSFLGDVPLGFQLFVLEDTIVGGIGAWVAILISIIITSFFIPNMLRRGTVDLLLVKPIHRSTLLLYKYVGGLIFIFLNTTIIVVGVWLALGLRSGIWAPSFLLIIFVITAFFAILYAVSTLFGVLTRSPVATILLTIGIWFILFLVGVFYQMGEGLRQQEKLRESAVAARKGAKEHEPKKEEPGANKKPNTPPSANDEPPEPREPPFRSDNWFFNTVRVVHFVLPRAKDLDYLMSNLLRRDLLTANQVKESKVEETSISWGESLTMTGVFLALMLGLACLRFATRDY